MKPTDYEMPSPESNDLEPLAKALVALRREEEPIAPSAELRRRVEARLDAIETNTSGAVMTKEKSMSSSFTNRFRLRDWIFVGGGSLAAAAATTIIFWPPPRAEVAVQTPPKADVSLSKRAEGDFRNSGFEYERPGVTLHNGQTASQLSSSTAQTAGPSGAQGMAGMGAGGMPGMAGSGSAPGGPGTGFGVGSFGNASGGVPGGKGAPGPTRSLAQNDAPSLNLESGALPSSSGPNPYPPAPLAIDPAGASDSAVASASAVPTTSPASGAELNMPKGASSGRGAGGGYAGMMPGMAGGAGGPPGMPGMPGGMPGMGGAMGMPGGPGPGGDASARDRYYRVRIAQQGQGGAEGQGQGVDSRAKGREEWYEKAYHFGSRFQADGEQYNTIVENAFLSPTSDPLSTFSIDVDTAAYSNVRRFLTAGQIPPPAAVRIEEMVNYFSYHYATPKGREPFAVNMEAAECPWNPGHVLLRVGLKGKEIERKARPASNLVFLLDVSGSMSDENKLPLLKTTMTMLVNELTENDRVTIVTYAGDAGLKLEPTSGDQKQKITDVISSLSAGGSTNGSAGIELAYQKASEAFIKEGTNRVILATDGDLNVGVTSDDALVKLIKEKAAGGTFLTVLGFGEGNLKDGKLEQIADNGNGMYGYIDSVREGRKMMVEQLSGSLVTIAKDVKIQIEFNPAQVQSYRLLGYENRVMAAADFNNDKKDAGEIGAGHTVTALYELVPVDANEKVKEPRPDVEPLKYQKAGLATRAVATDTDEPKALTEAAGSGELLTLKLRYKEPDGVESRLIEFPLKERGGRFNSASKDFQFAAAVASFGMILRGSQHRGSGSPSAVAEIAAGALGEDPNGLRAEFVDLVRRAEKLGIR